MNKFKFNFDLDSMMNELSFYNFNVRIKPYFTVPKEFEILDSVTDKPKFRVIFKSRKVGVFFICIRFRDASFLLKDINDNEIISAKRENLPIRGNEVIYRNNKEVARVDTIGQDLLVFTEQQTRNYDITSYTSPFRIVDKANKDVLIMNFSGAALTELLCHGTQKITVEIREDFDVEIALITCIIILIKNIEMHTG